MESAQEKATQVVAQLTLTEKLGLLSTDQKAVPRLHLPAFAIGGEAAHGIVDRNHYHTTSFPIPLTISQTWDPKLIEKVGTVISDEARGLYNETGKNRWLMPWAPTIDLERDPRWGRNEEGYGEDPYLTGKVSVGLMKGMQGHEDILKVAAAPKHFFANNTETGRGSESNTIIPRMKHEYYLKPFKFAFRDAHAQSMMTAYSGVNGIPMMQSPELLSTVKGDWQMDGCIVTDGGALTLNVEDYHYYDRFDDALADALLKGIDCFVDDADKVAKAAQSALDRDLIQEKDIDRALINTLKVRIRLGQMTETTPFDHLNFKDVGNSKHDQLVQQVYQSGTVLLKNDHHLLPLKSEQSLLITGPLANRFYRDWYATLPINQETPYQGLQKQMGNHVAYVNSNDFVKIHFAATQRIATSLVNKVYEIERWQDNLVFLRDRETKRYLRVNEAGEFELGNQDVYDWVIREAFYLDHNHLYMQIHDFGADDQNSMQAGGHSQVSFGSLELLESGTQRVMSRASEFAQVLVVMGNHPLVNARETEDRQNMALAPNQVHLCESLAQVTKPIGLIIGGYPFTVEELSVAALLFTGYAGQSIGTALANILLGKSAPTGKLSQTWYNARWHDQERKQPVAASFFDQTSHQQLPSMRQYDIEKACQTYQYVQPKFVTYPFGYGLTYGKLLVKQARTQLVDHQLTVNVELRNSNSHSVTDTVQVYLQATRLSELPNRQQLIAFRKVTLPAHTTKEFILQTNLADFAWYQPQTDSGYFPKGEYHVKVGFSAADPHAFELPFDMPMQKDEPGVTLASSLPAKAFDDYHNIELTSHAGHYELVALNAKGYVDYHRWTLPESTISIRLYAQDTGTLTLTNKETGKLLAKVTYQAADTLQTLHLTVPDLKQQSIRLQVSSLIQLLDFSKN